MAISTPNKRNATHMRPADDIPLGLTRSAGHVYSWNDGQSVCSPLPSVTTVLGVIDKSGPLVGWAKRETAACAIRNLDVLMRMRDTGGDSAAVSWLKAIPDYRRDTAADLGTRIHLLAAQIVQGIEPEMTADEAPFIVGYREFLIAFEPRFLAVEEMVCNLEHGYAGTLDAIAEIGGETWLLDLKSGSGIYPDTALQLAAYGSSEFIGRPGKPGRFRLPRATRYGVVHVRPEGTRLIEFAVDGRTFEAFLEARRLYEWKQGPARSVVGAAVPVTKGEVA